MAHGSHSTSAHALAEFPLYLHKASGHWCKTIKGRRHYFGKDKQAAYERWIREKDDLLVGRAPRPESDIVTLQHVCNYCLTKKAARVEDGDLSIRQFNDLKMMAKFLVEELGRNSSVESLTHDFGDLRRTMVRRWKPSGLVARIGNIKHIFRFAYENDVIKNPVKFGDQFKLPSKKIRRRERYQSGPRMFEPAEIRELIDHATPHMRAFILLGVNCGLGNADIAKMEMRHVDLDEGWLDYPRPKTEVPRRAKLWPETVAAIRKAREAQPASRGSNRSLVFVTRLRKPWSNPESSTCALCQAFRKLAKSLDLHSRGKTFYTLRHVAETIGGECRDQVAVDVMMGHDSGHIGGEYREGVSDERLERVADTIHAWLFRSSGRKPR